MLHFNVVLFFQEQTPNANFGNVCTALEILAFLCTALVSVFKSIYFSRISITVNCSGFSDSNYWSSYRYSIRYFPNLVSGVINL